MNNLQKHFYYLFCPERQREIKYPACELAELRGVKPCYKEFKIPDIQSNKCKSCLEESIRWLMLNVD